MSTAGSACASWPWRRLTSRACVQALPSLPPSEADPSAWLPLLQDPYILRTHLGTIECRLCLTLHTNEGSYLAHTQGKKHQTNLARRAARDVKEGQLLITLPKTSEVMKKTFIKIGRPGALVCRP